MSTTTRRTCIRQTLVSLAGGTAGALVLWAIGAPELAWMAYAPAALGWPRR